MESDNFLFTHENKQHRLSDFDIIWNRRFADNFVYNSFNISALDHISPSISVFLHKELHFLTDYILYLSKLHNKRIINDYDKNVLNKFIQLQKATHFGLKIPEFVLINNKKELLNFKKNKNIITKPASNLGYINIEKKMYSAYTTEILSSTFDDIPQRFFPSFFQKKLNVKFELKCILVGNNIFAVKQFNNSKFSSDDIKIAYTNKSIQLKEFTLKPNIKEKLLKLAKFFKLNLCTIDLIVDTNDNFYFLEINQDGIIEYYSQFLKIDIYDEIYKLFVNGKDN